jgi:hypothetical protein
VEEDPEIQGEIQEQVCCMREAERLPGKIPNVQNMLQVKCSEGRDTWSD